MENMEKNNSKQSSYFKRYFMLNAGFLICSLGVVFLLNSGLGVAPWDVLASGLSNTLPITVGQAIIIISVVLVIVEVIAGSNIGTGTVLNMVLIGAYIDMILDMNIIQAPQNFGMKLFFIFIWTIILNFGIHLYISQGFGAGPRDGLMMLMAKKFNVTVGKTKLINELVAVTLGYLLGGMFGMGTVIIAIFSGPMLNMQQKLLGFDLKTVEHEYISDYFKRN